MPSAHEHFSEQFEKWEKRGRGWQVFDEPVFPEPPFVPFTLRSMTEAPAVDNGRRPSFLGSLFRKVTTPPPQPAESEPEDEPEIKPLLRDSLVEFQVSLPDELDISRETFEQFFRNLALCQEPIGFELLGTHRRILAQFVASEEDASRVRKQLHAYFPDVTFQSRTDTLEEAWDASDGNEAMAVEFGLEHEFMLPLASGKLDPFIGIIGALAELEVGELGLFQVLFQPVQEPWAESIVNSVTHADGKPFFVNQPELAGAAEDKVSQPLYAVVVRILVRTATASRLQEIASGLASSLCVFSHPKGNELIPLNNEGYPFEAHIMDVLQRQSQRAGMLLNSDELIGFVHLPSSAVRSPELLRDSGRSKSAPSIVRGPPGVIIGDNEHNGETIPVFLKPDQRVRHTHIIGSNGTGKSSLLLNLIRQDIENGDGVAVLDPHGDLIDQILDFIPANRIKDVVLVNPADVDFPIAFNLMRAHSEEEKRLLASDLVSVFRRLATSWGDQMDTVLQNAILVILDSTRGGTLADLRRLLLEPAFLADFLTTVQDPELIYYWQVVFPHSGGGKSSGSVLARLQDFFSQKPLRNMVSQKENRLDFADIMDTGKIFLAKLSEGLCGEENSYLLGTLLIGKFQQLAMARQAQKMEARRNFWLYIDEFQHFISPSMLKILTGTRKYRLGFTLAHQELHQLQSDPKVGSAVMTQPCTRIVLRVGDDDAKKLGEGFASFDVKSLTRLEKFHAIVRVEQNDFDFNLALRKPELTSVNEEYKSAIIAASRAKYATPRADVEALLLAAIRGGIPKLQPPPDRSDRPKAKQSTPSVSPAPVMVPEVPQGLSESTLVKESSPPAAEIPNAEVQKEAEETSSHTAVKNTIGGEAESLDYTVSYEEHFPEIQARADVVLRRGKRTVICQVSATTPPEFEADSVRKYLKADFSHIAVVSISRRKLSHIQEILGDQISPKVAFYSPEEFISKLHDWAMDDPGGGAIERGKPRKRIFDFTQKTNEQRAIEEAKFRKNLIERMKRNLK